MKVFISWSGELSRELGEAFRDWLPAVIQNVKPFFTPDDIEKGSRWSKDIANELEASSVGIFCLTKENLSKPWIMFEAGALSKNLDVSKVCPILFGVENTDIEGPLVQFQSSPFEKKEIKSLLKTINSCLSDQKLNDSVLDEVFDMWWPKLEEKVSKILSLSSEDSGDHNIRDDRDILEEILELARLNASSVKKSRRSIHPDAIEDLITIASDIVAALGSGYSRQDILGILSTIEKPLKHCIEKSDVRVSKKNEFLEQFELIDFEAREVDDLDT